jgi:hypothetical protein
MNKDISFSSVMVGLSIIGNYENYLFDILNDNCKFEICLVIFNKENDRLPESIIEKYENLKNYFRTSFQNAINQESRHLKNEEEKKQREEAYNKRQKSLIAKNNFKEINNVAPEGTIDELSRKYGVSKSKIREMKREGKLHELESMN